MQRFIRLSLIPLFIALTGYSDMQNVDQISEEMRDPWYFTIGTGYAWSRNVDMSNTGGDWAPTPQGYNGNLNNGSFISLAFGKTCYEWFDFESEFQLYQPFHYQIFQTTELNNVTQNRYRIFDLDTFSWFFNLRFHLPKSWEWDAGFFSIGPFIGGGVGVGVNTVSNFHTVEYSQTASNGNYTSVGDVIRRNSFAWQANGGFYIRPPKSSATFHFAYRYYDGGTFNGPTTIMDNRAGNNGNIVSVPEWSGHFTSNQFYFFVKLEV